MKHRIIVTAVLAAVLVFAASCARIAPPQEPGPHNTGYFSVSYSADGYGVYQAVIRYPAVNGGELAAGDGSAGPYPGIVVSSGRSGGEWSVTWISEHLTSHGYVTLAFTPPDAIYGNTSQWAAGFTAGIEELIVQSGMESSPIYGMMDASSFGVIGFSMGGAGCIEAAGAPGSRVDALVALAPAGYNGSGTETATMRAAANVTAPVQLQAATADSFVTPQRVLPFYYDLIPESTTRQYIEIKGGNHIGFLDEVFAAIAGNFGMDAPNEIGFEEQRLISRRYFTAWFQYHLKGMKGYGDYLFAENAAVPNVSALEYVMSR